MGTNGAGSNGANGAGTNGAGAGSSGAGSSGAGSSGAGSSGDAAWKARAVSAEDVVARIPNGGEVFVHGAAMTPTPLLEAMCARQDLDEATLYHLHLEGACPFAAPEQRGRFHSVSLFTSPALRDPIARGEADFMPIFLREIPSLFTGGHVDLVIVQGVQGGGRRRRHPGGAGAGHRMADLLLQHRRHQVGHRPHSLADLGMALQAAGQADIDVPVLIGLDPGGFLHVALADHRPRFHGGVHLVAGPVEEAGVDETHALGCRADALLEVHRGAALLVHDAHLQRVGGHAQRRLDTCKELVGEGDFLRPVHLRLDDVERPGARVAAPTATARSAGADVVHGDCRRHHRIEDAFGNLVAVGIEDRGRGHQMADVAHQHQ